MLICVKVGASGFYSEVLTPTRCFVKKESGPGAILVNIAIIKNGVICAVKPFQWYLTNKKKNLEVSLITLVKRHF